jgi:hypothetical protein
LQWIAKTGPSPFDARSDISYMQIPRLQQTKPHFTLAEEAPLDRVFVETWLAIRQRSIETLISLSNLAALRHRLDKSLPARKRPPAWKPVVDDQSSICSAIFKASSTSIPRYRTVLSNLV